MDTTLRDAFSHPMIAGLLATLIVALVTQSIWVVTSLRKVLFILTGADGTNGLKGEVRRLNEAREEEAERRLLAAREDGAASARIQEIERRLTIVEKVVRAGSPQQARST